MPDPHSCARMLPVDRLPKEWRDLANEYGSNVVLALLDDHYTLEQATDALETRHWRRQEQLLATNYTIDRERFLKLARGSASRNRPLHARGKRRRRPMTGVREDSGYA